MLILYYMPTYEYVILSPCHLICRPFFHRIPSINDSTYYLLWSTNLYIRLACMYCTHNALQCVCYVIIICMYVHIMLYDAYATVYNYNIYVCTYNALQCVCYIIILKICCSTYEYECWFPVLTMPKYWNKFFWNYPFKAEERSLIIKI